jgi:hypothetical protein
MEPITLPTITIIRGSAFNDVLELYQDEEATLPVNLTGITFVGDIRSAPRASGYLLGTFLITTSTYQLQRHLFAVDTALMPIGGGWYDIKGTPSGGEPEVWFRGKIIIEEGR